MSIKLTGAASIYPCLDSFDLFISGSSLQAKDSEFARVIRLFYSYSLSKRDIRDLVYLKEYPVPFNNLLKLDCQSNIQFKVDAKMHCFQYVTRNLITEAIVESSRLFCFPTNVDDVNEFTRITLQQDAASDNNFKKLEIEKLRNLQVSPSLEPGSTVVTDEFTKDNSLLLNCECNVTTFISLNLNQIAHYFVYFTHGEFKIQIFKCDPPGESNNSKHNSHGNEISVTTKLLDSLNGDVCILNLTSIRGYKRIKVVNAEVNSVVYSTARGKSEKALSSVGHGAGNSEQTLHLRDGILSISPLITLSNTSGFQHLHSSFLRIESDDFYSLKLILSISHMTDDELLDTNLRLLHVVMAGIFAVCLFTCCISTVICISAGRETDKVITSDIMENATMLSETPGTLAQANNNEYASVGEDEGEGVKTAPSGKRNVSLSQFDLADVDSMEMDYYDYHCSINGGKKTPLLKNTASVTSSHKPGRTSSEPPTEEESAFNC